MGVTIEELGQFLKQEPPRSVPKSIRKAGLKGSSGVLILFGLIFSGGGVPFLYVFFPWNLGSDIQLEYGEKVTAKGTIQSMTETGMTISNNTESNHTRGISNRHHTPGTAVYEVTFKFPVKNAVDNLNQQLIQNGVCYITGTLYQRVGRAKGKKAKRVLIKPGQRVSVEYLKRDPSICMVKGARFDPMGNFGLFIIPFPIIGFSLIYFSLRYRKRRLGLLKRGHFATGVVTEVKSIGLGIDKVEYEITVAFNPGDGDRTSTYVYSRGAKIAERKMESGEDVGILYDPNKPERLLIADSLIQ